MNVYALPQQLHIVTNTPRSIALGVFDGVHIGHRAVLSRALLNTELSPAVFTFSGMESVKTDSVLQTKDERLAMFKTLGFADVFEADFSAIRDLSPKAFVDMLQTQLSVKAIVCGYNFHFGKDGVGDTDLLKELCDAAGISLQVIPAVTADGESVSSTRIRKALADGNVRLVTRLLSAPFTITALVEFGQQLGRELGTPTINQRIPNSLTLPRFGVYASLAIVDGKAIPAVTNIGVKPTVGNTQPTAETYILGFAGELYGQILSVQLIEFLRDEKKFPSVDALREQIQKDVAAVTALFTPQNAKLPKAIIFDFDDTIQDRDAAMAVFVHFWLRREFSSMSEEDIQSNGARMLEAGKHGFLPYTAMLREAENIFPNKTFDEAEFLRLLSIVFPANTTLFPDAIQTLQALRNKGYKIGLLTNGLSAIQNRKVDVAGVRPLFDYILISGDDGLQKPNEEAFRRTALRLGVHPADCVYVGDNPENDVRGAKSAGMQAVFRASDFNDFFSFSYDNIMDSNATAKKLSADDILSDDSVPHIRSLTELIDMY